MKRLFRICALVITLCCIIATSPTNLSAQQNDVSFQLFYDQLSPYGNWIEYSDYGYVWIPSLDSDFSPYQTNGYWVMSEYGWAWVSDYEWGWAAFHYGRWDYSDSYGWFWVPDNEWGPSWVTWRRSEGYYGWAPMRPGVTINLSFGGYNDVPYDRWVFVKYRDMERHDAKIYYVNRRENSRIFNKSSVINKTFYDDKRRQTYVAGPGRDEVQKFTGRTINPVVIRERDKPGQNFTHNQLELFRPQVQRDNGVNKPAPSRVAKLNDVKRNFDRETPGQPQGMNFSNRKTGAVKQDPPKNINNVPIKPRNENVPIDNRNKITPIPKRNSDPPKRENNKERPVDIRKTNPPDNNRINNNIIAKPQKAEPPVKENRIERPVPPKSISLPKNNGADKTPKVLPANPQRNRDIENKAKIKSNSDKKKINERMPF